MFDTKTSILYVTSDYFNELYTESSYEKVILGDVVTELQEYVKSEYNKVIVENTNELKRCAVDKFNEFFAIRENRDSIEEEAENLYKDNMLGQTIIKYFEIAVPNRLPDVCEYIIDKDKFANTIIQEDLDATDYKLCSYYSGIEDIKVNHREYIGFRLLKQDRLQELMKDIDEDKNPKSIILKKLRAIKEFVNDNGNMKNVTLGFRYKGNSLEVSYPIEDLRRLDLADYYMPVSSRSSFRELFSDISWSDRITPIMSIEYIKYRGKVVYGEEG
jgi:hypothetical protein